MAAERRIRGVSGGIAVATLLAYGFSLWVSWPWLRAEHDRLETPLAFLVWFSDGAALLAVIWFGIKYSVLGRLLVRRRSEGREFRYLLASLLVAFAIDASATAVITYREATGESRAVEVAGQIVGGRLTREGTIAYLVCRFQDQGGVQHDSNLHVYVLSQPQAVRDAVSQGRFPMPVVVRYDASWPQRCWLAGFNNDDGNRLCFASFSFLLFQGMGIVLGIFLEKSRDLPPDRAPWYMITPQIGQLTPLFLASAAKYCMGDC